MVGWSDGWLVGWLVDRWKRFFVSFFLGCLMVVVIKGRMIIVTCVDWVKNKEASSNHQHGIIVAKIRAACANQQPARES
jgi:hypothetical protein